MKKKGFTLIEAVVASAIFFMLLQGVYDFYIHNTRIMDREKKKTDIDMVSKSLIDQINQSLKTAYQYDDKGNFLIKIDDDGNKISMEIPKGNTSAYYDSKNAISLSFEKDRSKKAVVIKRSDIPKSQAVLEGYVDDFSVTDEDGFYKVLLKIDYGLNDSKKDFVVYYYPRKVDK